MGSGTTSSENEKKILFFNVLSANIDRFPGELHSELRAKAPSWKSRCVYVEETFSGDDERLPRRYRDMEFMRTGYSIGKLVDSIRSFAPDVLVTVGKRPPDLLATALANELGAETYVFQHGMERPYLPRKRGIVLDIPRKLLFYALCLRRVSRACDVAFLQSLRDYRAYYLKGQKEFRDSVFQSTRAIPDWAFVYGDYWKEFFERHFGVPRSRSFVVGCPDLMWTRDQTTGEPRPGICYIAQSLVEDGRMERARFGQLLQEMASGVPSEMPFYIKLHPRSDRALYDEFLGGKEVRLVESFPWTEWYLGHYSSLLFVPAYRGRKVVVWRLEDEPIPEVLMATSYATVERTGELRKVLRGEAGGWTEEADEILESYMSEFEEGPFARAIDVILRRQRSESTKDLAVEQSQSKIS